MRTNRPGLVYGALFWVVGILPVLSYATTHVVQFGGNAGLTYVPDEFTALVGDTVRWVGPFGPHPLSSTSVPLGGATWRATAGTEFSYRITIAGTYHYKCDFHEDAGMIGSFTAASNTGIGAVPGHVAASADRAPLLAIVTHGGQRIRLVVPRIERVVVSVHDARGRGSSILNAIMGPGGYDIPLEFRPADGVCVVTVVTNGRTQASAFAIVH